MIVTLRLRLALFTRYYIIWILEKTNIIIYFAHFEEFGHLGWCLRDYNNMIYDSQYRIEIIIIFGDLCVEYDTTNINYTKLVVYSNINKINGNNIPTL